MVVSQFRMPLLCRLDPVCAAATRSKPIRRSLLRGRVKWSRTGTLPIDVLKRVISEAGPRIERLDLFNYGEPFLYRHLVEGLRHIRCVMPGTSVAISTDGLQVRPAVEDAIIGERLLDWVIFSIDGVDDDS